jgi:shikimate kinase/3-dehydroquinate synthase
MTHIFLYGPPGTGKSTVGEKLAGNLKLPFIDLDRVIEMNAGMPIPQIMEQQGEPAFREVESAALKNLLSGKKSVVALGGGALLRNENRTFAESQGKVIVLMAELQTMLERMQNDSGKRPLLAGNMRENLGSLLAQRREHYSSFPVIVPVDRKLVSENVYLVQTALGWHHLSAMGEYDVIVQSNGIEQLGEMLKSRGLQNPLIVADENVAKFHTGRAAASLRSSGYDPKILNIPSGEAHKNLETISQLWHGFLEAGLNRKSTVVALGGGVVGDLAGFAASTYMRGIAWVGVPTTLLAMVDASLGGKTGFDLPEGKNLIGAFHSPALVLADPQLLKTLPEAELISGMAEVVKHGIISDPELFKMCSYGLDWVRNNLEEIVKRAIAVKISVIEGDPYEQEFRAALNLGHTVGHAVELVSKFKLRHGEAIAIGMIVEAGYSARIGLANPGLLEVMSESLKGLGLPIRVPEELSRGEIIRAMSMDKKRSAKAIRFALPVEIGKVELVEVTDLESVLE